MEKGYLDIVSHYESCLERHGDSHLGVDWPNLGDAEKRYRVMLEVISSRGAWDEVTLLDFGCGTGALLSYLRTQGVRGVRYAGLDLSPKFIAVCRGKFPETPFWHMDVLENDALGEYDFIVMNGVFTEKRGLSFEAMLEYFQRTISTLWKHARIGMAFNVMTKHVDWERDDLFHLPFDTLAAFLRRELGRNFIFRNDYGLYEYTAYVYK
jgi:SAM-dependent methyltransferase